MDVVAGVTAVFTNRTLWSELRNKAPLGQGIIQHTPLLLAAEEALAMNTTTWYTIPDEAVTK